jgi:hypothetical protein
MCDLHINIQMLIGLLMSIASPSDVWYVKGTRFRGFASRISLSPAHADSTAPPYVAPHNVLSLSYRSLLSSQVASMLNMHVLCS